MKPRPKIYVNKPYFNIIISYSSKNLDHVMVQIFWIHTHCVN